MNKKRSAFCAILIICLMLPGLLMPAAGENKFFFFNFDSLLNIIRQESAAEDDPICYIEIDVKDYGKIVAELYPDVAPITVKNFLQLVDRQFYDGLTFHRIISGFMVQGGCPLGNGTGGSGTNIKGEFSQNGVENSLKHTRGVLSMARASHPDSASSQFFIMHQDAPHLDGGYAAFGKVISGMEVVDALCRNTPVIDGNGTVHPYFTPVINSIRQVELP